MFPYKFTKEEVIEILEKEIEVRKEYEQAYNPNPGENKLEIRETGKGIYMKTDYLAIMIILVAAKLILQKIRSFKNEKMCKMRKSKNNKSW